MLKAEFFDIFGVLTFAFISYAAVRGLLQSGTLPDWILYILLLIGIAGLIIDGAIVYKTYIKK